MTQRGSGLGAKQDEGGSRHVGARISDDGDLIVEGQDLGPAVEELLGGGEYEWAVTVRAAEFPRVREVLGLGDGDLLAELAEHHGGEPAFRIRRTLEDAGLIADRWSRVG